MKSNEEPIASVATLEWANYAATLATANVTPGLDVILRDDVVITTSDVFPSPDANHACLLRATAQTVDHLITTVINHFKAKHLDTTIFVSPACTPSDLPDRLLARQFTRKEAEEAWLAFDLANSQLPAPLPNVMVRPVARDEVLTIAEIFLATFEMPTDLAPFLARLLEPSLEVPTVHHYIALIEEQPVGTCSLLRYENFGILGSAGVLPTHRGSGAATNLVIRAAADARKRGVDTLITQTTADTRLERLLRLSGFKRAFTRTCYTLP